jgi:hypothetical protein
MRRLSSSQLDNRILEHVAVKVLGIIDYDPLRDPITTDNVLPEKILDGRGDCGVDSPRLNPFHEVFHCHNGEGVIALCWCEIASDINAPML